MIETEYAHSQEKAAEYVRPGDVIDFADCEHPASLEEVASADILPGYYVQDGPTLFTSVSGTRMSYPSDENIMTWSRSVADAQASTVPLGSKYIQLMADQMSRRDYYIRALEEKILAMADAATADIQELADLAEKHLGEN